VEPVHRIRTGKKKLRGGEATELGWDSREKRGLGEFTLKLPGSGDSLKRKDSVYLPILQRGGTVTAVREGTNVVAKREMDSYLQRYNMWLGVCGGVGRVL